MHLLNLIDKALLRLEGWLLMSFLAAMVIFTFAQVSLRALFVHGDAQWANMFMGKIDWTEPLVRLLVLWVTFLGASVVTGENKHIKMDLMSGLLPRRLLPYREVLLSLASAVVIGLMLYSSIGYVRMEAKFGTAILSGVPSWIGQLILPAGFLSILFRFVLKAIREGASILCEKDAVSGLRKQGEWRREYTAERDSPQGKKS